MLYLKIKVKSGIYRIRVPMGRTGAIHFAIVTKYMDSGQTELTLADKAALESGEKLKSKPVSAETRANISEAFIEWSSKVLPQIIVGFTPADSETENTNIKIDDILGQDQFAIFMALLEQLEVDDEFFRIIE